MSNVLSEEKKQQVIALGKLGWSLRRIEQLTGVRRETAPLWRKNATISIASFANTIGSEQGFSGDDSTTFALLQR